MQKKGEPVMFKMILLAMAALGISCAPVLQDKSLPFTFAAAERMD